MIIQLNGERHEVREGSTIADLLASQDLIGKRVAVERNGEIVPRSQHTQQILHAGDAIEIVHAIGGG